MLKSFKPVFSKNARGARILTIPAGVDWSVQSGLGKCPKRP